MVLGFVARRLLAEWVAFVVAVREPDSQARASAACRSWRLGGLGEVDARALLARSRSRAGSTGRVRDRIVAETRGNPLALLDLPGSMSAAELAGGFDAPAVTDLPRHLEDHYLRRAGELPEATQRLLLLVAAEPIGRASP